MADMSYSYLSQWTICNVNNSVNKRIVCEILNFKLLLQQQYHFNNQGWSHNNLTIMLHYCHNNVTN